MWRSGSPWEAACWWPRHWLAIGVVWANTAGIAGDALLGMTIGKLIIYLRREHREAVGYDNLLGLGLIGLAYGSG